MRKIIFVGVILMLSSQVTYAKKEKKFFTQGQLAQMFYDLMTSFPNFKDLDEYTQKLSDVPLTHPNFKAITYTYLKHCGAPSKYEFECGISYRWLPDILVSKYQLYKILPRFFEIIEKEYNIKFPCAYTNIFTFPDLTLDEKACDAVLVTQAYIQGYPFPISENKNFATLSEAKKYFAIIKSTTEKLLKQKGSK